MTHHELEFTKSGAVFAAAQETAILAALANYTDLIVVSHGWNNDKADAKQLYDNLFASVEAVLLAKPGLATRKFGVVRIFWPSKKFADNDLIPGGGASVTENDRALIKLLEELKRDANTLGGVDVDAVRSAKIDEAITVIGQLDNAAAKTTFVMRIREILDPTTASTDDVSNEFFQIDPQDMFRHFGQAVIAPPPAGTGGAATVGGAAGLRDIVTGTKAAARRIVNFATYYQMKDRAGIVGQVGVGPAVNRWHKKSPSVKFHFAGHSFGGRLVTAAIAALGAGAHASSMTLLQAAYSHNGLARNFDGSGNDGFFRSIVDNSKVAGPIVITHTKNDQAVGIAYPLASRLARQAAASAAALGDRNDPYGGMGRNGAQKTPEVDSSERILAKTPKTYQFKAGRVFNLLADAFITNHGDVAGEEVAQALLDAIAVT